MPIEYSKELRALALRFFAFDDAFWVERTKVFMETSSEMHDLRGEIDKLLKVMRSGKPFKEVCGKKTYRHNDPVLAARAVVNKYSLGAMFEQIFLQANRLADWGHSSRFNIKKRLPQAEALAWIAYFAEYDETSGKYVPGKNWVVYYNENYGSQVIEKSKEDRAE